MFFVCKPFAVKPCLTTNVIALKKKIPSFSQMVTPAEGISDVTSSLCRIVTVQKASVDAKTVFSTLHAPVL